MKKIFISLIMFFACNSFVMASDVFSNPITASEAASNVPAFNSVSCKFKQEKYMKLSQIALVSNGDFQFIKDKGVIFETKYPIQSTASYTAGQNKTVNAIIKSISNQNYSFLEKNFELYYTRFDENWILGLKPKANGTLNGEMEDIVIFGTVQKNQGNINKMIINTQSMRTTIDFTNCG